MPEREPGRPAPKDPRSVGLPIRPFLYTMDQLSVILDVETSRIRAKFIWYEGREIGARDLDRLKAVNISPGDGRPEWRVSEQELVRWMKRKKFKYYERAWVE